MDPLPQQLDQAVLALCPEVEVRIRQQARRRMCEARLWREMACCTLSSQVKYEIAYLAARNLSAAGMGTYLGDLSDAQYEHRALRVLETPIRIGRGLVRYRFPRLRAAQLSETRRNLRGEAISLASIVYGELDEHRRRSELMRLVAGFGPKQASMFLRNSGAAQELAILDRHALTFMRWRKLSNYGDTRALTLKQYERTESVFRGYADDLGYSTGCVDSAVWIVVRAAKQMRMQ